MDTDNRQCQLSAVVVNYSIKSVNFSQSISHPYKTNGQDSVSAAISCFECLDNHRYFCVNSIEVARLALRHQFWPNHSTGRYLFPLPSTRETQVQSARRSARGVPCFCCCLQYPRKSTKYAKSLKHGLHRNSTFLFPFLLSKSELAVSSGYYTLSLQNQWRSTGDGDIRGDSEARMMIRLAALSMMRSDHCPYFIRRPRRRAFHCRIAQVCFLLFRL